MQKKGKISTKKPKKLQPIKPSLNWAYIKHLPLPDVYTVIEYTPEELRKKFREYLIRSDKYAEEVCVSWFCVFIWRTTKYLLNKENDKSKDFLHVVDMIMQYFESRYEQKISNWMNLAYLMNNRFKWSWESLSKNEDKVNINSDVKWVLDKIIKKKDNDKEW